jgi:hypothetical protein
MMMMMWMMITRRDDDGSELHDAITENPINPLHRLRWSEREMNK